MRLVGVAAIGSLFTQQLFAADVPPAAKDEPLKPMPFATDPVVRTDLGNGVTLLQGPGGNITQVVGNDGSSFIIDCGVPSRAGDVAAAAKQTTGTMPTMLIDTHWHYDHAGGNEGMRKAGVATIVAHENTLKRLSTPQHNQYMGMDFPADPEAALPNATVTDGNSLRLNGGQLINVGFCPNAHTDGDLYLHITRGDVLVCGDLFFNGLFPFIDISSGGSIDGMIAASDKLLSLATDATVIIPGHGNPGRNADVQKFRDMLQTARDRVAKLVANGKTEDETVAAKPLADLDAQWGQRMFHSSHFTRLIYPMLKKS